MGTRAVYFFEDKNDKSYYGVYKHYDGYRRCGSAH